MISPVCFKFSVRKPAPRLIWDLDSFEGGPGGALVAAAHGADVKIIGCTWLMVPHGIFVHDNITSMDQLSGKTIAISSPGAFPEIFAKGALDHFNIPEDAVKYASLGGDLDRYKALVADVVDAAVVSGEYTPIAAKEHIKMLVSAQGSAAAVSAHVPARDRQRRSRRGPHDAAKFLAGEMLGLRYAVAHKDEVLKVTQQVTDIKPDDPRPAYIYDLAMAAACHRHRCADPAGQFQVAERRIGEGRQHSQAGGPRRRCSTTSRARMRSNSSRGMH